jgi:hypothetical protein
MTTSPTLLLSVRVACRAVTGNPSSGRADRRLNYRRMIEQAIRNAYWTKPIPPVGPLSVRITATRHTGSRGDADNIAKPILDALAPVLGVDSCGRVADDRVRHLEVTIEEASDAVEEVRIEVHLARGRVRHAFPCRREQISRETPSTIHGARDPRMLTH